MHSKQAIKPNHFPARKEIKNFLLTNLRYIIDPTPLKSGMISFIIMLILFLSMSRRSFKVHKPGIRFRPVIFKSYDIVALFIMVNVIIFQAHQSFSKCKGWLPFGGFILLGVRIGDIAVDTIRVVILVDGGWREKPPRRDPWWPRDFCGWITSTFPRSVIILDLILIIFLVEGRFFWEGWHRTLSRLAGEAVRHGGREKEEE